MNNSPANSITAGGDVSVESLMAQVADEYLERLERGERPDIEEYSRRYPDIAAFLLQMLPALGLMRQTGAEENGVSGPSGDTGTLGDFRLLRQVGRGGMGIVYEAEQI